LKLVSNKLDRFAIILVFSTGTVIAQGRTPADFVDVSRALPTLQLKLRYASVDNFTHTRVYPVARCLLRRSVVERLARVQAELATKQLRLELWDCYRPLSVQRRFFALVPDPRYVADPQKGSRHNRGAAVDVTLVDARGRELDMGTGFDDFSPRAHRDAADLGDEARRNRAILDGAMARAGFLPFATEWWHFDAPDWETFPLSDVPLEAIVPR
jgi:D-alanyl-D-alanine dipeptidase